MMENALGYRSYQEIFSDYQYIVTNNLEHLYTLTQKMQSLTTMDIKNAMIVYVRSGRPQLGFLILGRKARGGGGIDAPDPPWINKQMADSLGELNEAEGKSGSILASENWSFLLNDLFISGAVANRVPFYLASPRTQKNLWNQRKKQLTIYARELIGLFAVGYELQHLADGSEAMVPPCENTTVLTLANYNDILSRFQKSDNISFIMHRQIRRFIFNSWKMEFIPEFYITIY